MVVMTRSGCFWGLVFLVIVVRGHSLSGGYFFLPGVLPLGRFAGLMLFVLLLCALFLRSVLVLRSVHCLVLVGFRVLCVGSVVCCTVGVFGVIFPQWFRNRKAGCMGSGHSLVLCVAWPVSLVLPSSAFPAGGNPVEGMVLFFFLPRGPWRCFGCACVDVVSSWLRFRPFCVVLRLGLPVVLTPGLFRSSGSLLPCWIIAAP